MRKNFYQNNQFLNRLSYFIGPSSDDFEETSRKLLSVLAVIVCTPWHSDEMKGKVHVLFYVDPDFKDINNDASEALKAEKFPRDKYQPIAIINMGATWLPNFVIKPSLKGKQKQYPDTIYVRDNQKVIIKAWEIEDENNNVLAFDKEGKLIFIKEGKLNPKEINTLIELIYQHLEK